MSRDRFRRLFLLFVVIAVSVAFALTVRSFLLTIFLAAIFSGLAYPLYARLYRAFHNAPLASLATLVIVFVIIAGPLLGVIGVVANQALLVSAEVRERIMEDPAAGGGPAGAEGIGETVMRQLRNLPGMSFLLPYGRQIVEAVSAIAQTIGSFLVGWLSDATRMTVTFFFHFFILLYSMFFFLKDGPSMLASALEFLPLREGEKEQVKDRFLSVTRATLKGTLVIGVIQGSLSGLAFWVAGIPNSLFWAVIMMVLSILPVVGGALVWVPAAIILVASGKWLTGLLLALFCGIVVGSVDNVLRPRLVGRDTKMHDLLILFSTLGGLAVFGPIGFIVGPILAGLFVTSWELFAKAYRDVLTEPDGS